ncbi:putative transcription factor interactor and regulator CCHC(Zn) family [Rosa chinensis]|uniref:Putative transcription factor interactor and regulator CCHC(Zn) family n=1 Tax=Rosa chinensis TaxID=74649 RepID=A0A2P6Q7K0_ROSCH|nr:putative transcription factor interactor and regulator CCHC(Zn) family [Rosa chinensis]
MHFPMSINQIELLNGLNFKKWKSDIELNLGILDFDHVLREEPPADLPANANKETRDKFQQWHRHNRMAMICMKKSMTDAVKGGIPDSKYARVYFNSIAEKYKVSDKAETGNLMNKLIRMKFNGQGNMREYIMQGIDIAGKLKDLNVTIEDSFLVHLLLNSLSEQYSHLKSLYNTQKEKWSLNELISICVQEEDEVNKRGKAVSINLMSKPKFKKSFGNKRFKGSTSKDPMKTDLNKGKSLKLSGPKKCFFCKKLGHFKKDCEGFKNWLNKKGIIKDNNPKKE